MSRSGSFGAIPAGAERRRRRLSSVMVADCPRAQRRDWSRVFVFKERRPANDTATLRFTMLHCSAAPLCCGTQPAWRPITNQTSYVDTTRTFRSELREALQNTGLSILRQSQFVDTRRYPRLYLVVPVERLVDGMTGG